jgi:nuclear pore complex protein Nup155
LPIITEHIATLLVRFSLAHKEVLSYGWAPRILVQCGVPFGEIWDVLHNMYESQVRNRHGCCYNSIIDTSQQVPPFNEQTNVQAISSDIAVILSDWLEAAKRPPLSFTGQEEFPVGRIDVAVDQYLAELESSRAETKAIYEDIKRQLRRSW